MKKHQRVRFEMLLRVRDYGAAHRELFPESSPGAEAFDDVARAIEQIETHTASKLLVATRGRQEMAVARTAIRGEMRRIARTARGLRKARTPAGWKFRMPSRLSDAALLTAARAFLDAGGKQKEALVRLGLPDTCLDTLRESVDSMETALAARRDGRGGVAAANAAIRSAFALAARALATLDIVVPNAVELDPQLIARWERDRRVVGGEPKHPSHEAEPVHPAAAPAMPATEAVPSAALPKAS